MIKKPLDWRLQNINLTMGYLQEDEDDPKIIVEEEMQQPVLLLVSEFIVP